MPAAVPPLLQSPSTDNCG